MKIKKSYRGIFSYIIGWFVMILLVVLMPILTLFKYSVNVEAKRIGRI